jgi:hypothetical protein
LAEGRVCSSGVEGFGGYSYPGTQIRQAEVLGVGMDDRKRSGDLAVNRRLKIGSIRGPNAFA